MFIGSVTVLRFAVVKARLKYAMRVMLLTVKTTRWFDPQCKCLGWVTLLGIILLEHLM